MKKKATALLEKGYTLALVKGEKVYTSTERGIKPLLELFDTGADFSEFYAADKVVGRAAAFIYTLMKIPYLYAKTVSSAAMEILLSAHIEVEFGECTERILSRKKDGFCPMESAVIGIKNEDEALAAIRKKLSEINSN